MKLKELFTTMEIWMTNEESKLLEKLQSPVKLSSLSEHEQFRIQSMIRKNLVSKIGFNNPSVVANENKDSN
jgi:hypothetical protein